MQNKVNHWQYVGFFTLTYKTKHNMLASLQELARQYGRAVLLEDRKKVSISIFFQKVCMGWKLSPIITWPGEEGECPGRKKIEK